MVDKTYNRFHNSLFLDVIVMQTKPVTIVDFEDKLTKNAPIPKKWKKYMLEEFKRQVNELDEFEEIAVLLKAWSWVVKPSKWIWTTIELLNSNPASSAYLLMIDYIFNEGIDQDDFSARDEKKYTARFRRALYRLYRAGIIKSMIIKPEEVGPGKSSVAIWITPWVKDKDIQHIKDFYLNLGGAPGFLKKDETKTAKNVHKHNVELEILSAMRKYDKQAKIYDYYKCPKKHTNGLRRQRKTTSYLKRKNLNLKCTKCNKDLIEIKYDEWRTYKKKSLYHPEKDSY